jgi:hypothetical protein
VNIDWHAYGHSPAEAAAGTRDSSSGLWRNVVRLLKLPIGSAAKAA